jgi:hypothetical protein
MEGPVTVCLPWDTSPRNSFAFDLLEVRDRSFRWDPRLVFLSFLIGFFGRWKTRGRKV